MNVVMAMRYELVIFDLDGTLLDTLDDLTQAVNHALELQDFPLRTRDEVRHLIGNGIASTMRRAIPEGSGDDVFRQALSDFKGYYLSHVNVHTRPYTGVPGLLDAMGSAGIRAAVNSNKVDSATQALCGDHLAGKLACVLGEQPDIPKKPAPDGALRIIRQLGADPRRTLYVGDGETDILTAKNAGIDCAWVAWGYRRAPELGDLAVPHAFATVQALQAFILGN
ncbi:MAG: HAD family hydrolase [Clostridiales bacterium]|nr:HAD family hydrolase [Clostridiales bacterium]